MDYPLHAVDRFHDILMRWGLSRSARSGGGIGGEAASTRGETWGDPILDLDIMRLDTPGPLKGNLCLLSSGPRCEELPIVRANLTEGLKFVKPLSEVVKICRFVICPGDMV